MNWQETVLKGKQIAKLCVRNIGWDKPVSKRDLLLIKPLFEAQAKISFKAGYEAHKAEMCDHCDTPLLREGELYQKLDEAEQRGIRKVIKEMINRANAGLDALSEDAAPYWKGYWKGLRDFGQAFLKEHNID